MHWHVLVCSSYKVNMLRCDTSPRGRVYSCMVYSVCVCVCVCVCAISDGWMATKKREADLICAISHSCVHWQYFPISAAARTHVHVYVHVHILFPVGFRYLPVATCTCCDVLCMYAVQVLREHSAECIHDNVQLEIHWFQVPYCIMLKSWSDYMYTIDLEVIFSTSGNGTHTYVRV